MVLQHQVFMHNTLTAANHAGRLTERDAVVMNRVLERPESFESESTQRRYASAADKVVKALLFVDEPKLASPVRGTADFASDFSSHGPFDSDGRSFRRLNLQSRLFEWPCSFLVYSSAFQNLPVGVMTRVEARLSEVLSGRDGSGDYDHLSERTRADILQILRETTKLNLEVTGG